MKFKWTQVPTFGKKPSPEVEATWTRWRKEVEQEIDGYAAELSRGGKALSVFQTISLKEIGKFSLFAKSFNEFSVSQMREAEELWTQKKDIVRVCTLAVKLAASARSAIDGKHQSLKALGLSPRGKEKVDPDEGLSLSEYLSRPKPEDDGEQGRFN